MAQVKLGNDTVNTNGSLPAVGSKAPEFVLTGNDMKDVHSKTYAGQNIVLNIFPSIDTKVCASSVREFNSRVSSLSNTVVLCVSKDLPWAMRRFCGAEGIDKVTTLSDFRDYGFTNSYGIKMIDGGMAGVFARAIVIIGTDGKVKYTELVPAIGQPPDYEAALKAL